MTDKIEYINKLQNTIKNLVEIELKEANKKHSATFQTRHEAYAVLKEELQEALIEIVDIVNGLEQDYFNNHCMKDKQFVPKNTLRLLDCLEASTKCAIYELIQFNAMINKAKLLEK
jgi:hypothetical protein